MAMKDSDDGAGGVAWLIIAVSFSCAVAALLRDDAELLIKIIQAAVN